MKHDFEIIASYLLPEKHFSEELIETYQKALSTEVDPLSPYQAKVWKRMMNHRWILGCYDSGMAVLEPHSPLRKRIFIALAILECTPEFESYFSDRKYNAKEIAWLIFELPYAICNLMIGLLLVKMKV